MLTLNLYKAVHTLWLESADHIRVPEPMAVVAESPAVQRLVDRSIRDRDLLAAEYWAAAAKMVSEGADTHSPVQD